MMNSTIRLLFIGCIICAITLVTVSGREEVQDSTGVDNDEAKETPPTTDHDDDEFDDEDGVPPVPEGMVRENLVKWSAPELNDEEAHSVRLPSNLKCDGCTAVAHQVSYLSDT